MSACATAWHRVFLTSKVWPTHVTGNGIARACDASRAAQAHEGHESDSLAAPSFTDGHGMRRNRVATKMLAAASVAGQRNLPPQLAA